MKYLDFAKAVLREHEYKVTKPRLLVLEVLNSTKKPLNAYEIAQKAEADGHKIDVSTVYRILEVYRSLNLAHFYAQKHRYSACRDFDCEQDTHCHHEFVCKKCDQVMEVHVDDTELIKLINKSNKNLHVDEHNLELSGVCSSCKK